MNKNILIIVILCLVMFLGGCVFKNLYPQEFLITLSAEPPEGGTVTGEGIYEEGTTITIYAHSNEDYILLDWTENGNSVCDIYRYEFTVLEDRELVANFFNPDCIEPADPEYVTPSGYNDHDYQKLISFLEIEVSGKKNGERLNPLYDPLDPSTWEGVEWTEQEDKEIIKIGWYRLNVLGPLDLSGCKKLEDLNCSENLLTRLDTSDCTNLKNLSAKNNELTTLSISNCYNLSNLECTNNRLTHLDVSNYTNLKRLRCSNNYIESLNIAGCNKLSLLDLSNNSLSELQLSDQTELKELRCKSNQLANLDIKGSELLSCLYCGDNQLSELDVSKNSKLKKLFCENNHLSTLELGENKILELLNCFENNLTEINIKSLPKLSYLDCKENLLTNLDVSSCQSLETIYCTNNKLTDINLKKCEKLKNLFCSKNQLRNLNLDGLYLLDKVYCSNNMFTFSSLPILPSEISTYKYSPQLPVKIGEDGTIKVDMEVDLSSEFMIQGEETSYYWFLTDGRDRKPSSSENGIFTFNSDFEGQEIQCKMYNNTFPALILITEAVLVE